MDRTPFWWGATHLLVERYPSSDPVCPIGYTHLGNSSDTYTLPGLSNGSKYFQYPVLKVLAKYCRSDFAVEVLWVRIFCELAVAACTASALRLSDMFVYSETFVDGVQHWRTRITSQFTHSEGLLREITDFSDSVELNSKESVGSQPTKVWKERDVEAVD